MKLSARLNLGTMSRIWDQVYLIASRSHWYSLFWTAVPCTPSLWQNYVTESQIRCPDSEDVPRDKVLDSEPAQLKPRFPIVKLPWRKWERSGEDHMLNEQTLTWYQWQLTKMIWWQCNLGEWIKPALGLGVATSIIWLADTSSFFTNQRWYNFKYFLRLPFLTKADYV